MASRKYSQSLLPPLALAQSWYERCELDPVVGLWCHPYLSSPTLGVTVRRRVVYVASIIAVCSLAWFVRIFGSYSIVPSVFFRWLSLLPPSRLFS